MSQAVTLHRPFEGLKLLAARLKLRAQTLWRAHPRETVGFGLFGLIASAAISGTALSVPEAAAQAAAPPAPPPLLMQQLAPEQALKVNAAIPVAGGPNPAAAPFAFRGDKAARARALECLTSAVYYEAGSQDEDGERAVAQVVLNRVRHPAFPSTVCGVVYEGSTRTTGCQFTFTCDGSMYRQPDAEGWKRAYRVAEAALSGYVFAPVGYATHYHADYVVPYWASSLAKNTVVGAHIFYRWAGSWGRPAAFLNAYAGREPDARGLRNAALAANHVIANSGSELAQAIDEIPGAEPITITPSMRGDKRVAVRFNLTARKASEDAAHENYVEKFDSSDNLKWALSGDGFASSEQPLGKTSPAVAVSGGASAASGTAGASARR